MADENEGRRTLLANTLEREGFDITRAGTLRQAEGTALATMPEIVLMDGEWNSGDAIDAAQRLMSDPEFAFKCRIVVLARNSSQEYLVSAAKAGISEGCDTMDQFSTSFANLWDEVQMSEFMFGEKGGVIWLR